MSVSGTPASLKRKRPRKGVIMLPLQTGREASLRVGAFLYERDRPEQPLLYPLIRGYYLELKVHLTDQGAVSKGQKYGGINFSPVYTATKRY